jgi:hypothetical protein
MGTAMNHIGEHGKVETLIIPVCSHPDASMNWSTVRTFRTATHPYVVVICFILGEFLLSLPSDCQMLSIDPTWGGRRYREATKSPHDNPNRRSCSS